MTMADAKPCILSKKPVTYDGREFILTAVIARVQKGQWYYQAELWDGKENAVYIAELEKVICQEQPKQEVS